MTPAPIPLIAPSSPAIKEILGIKEVLGFKVLGIVPLTRA